jgi:hypothetical protein
MEIRHDTVPEFGGDPFRIARNGFYERLQRSAYLYLNIKNK